MSDDEYDSVEFNFTAAELDELEARLSLPGPSNLAAYLPQRVVPASPTREANLPLADPTFIPILPHHHESPIGSSPSDYMDDDMFNDPQFLSSLNRQLDVAESEYAAQASRAGPEASRALANNPNPPGVRGSREQVQLHRRHWERERRDQRAAAIEAALQSSPGSPKRKVARGKVYTPESKKTSHKGFNSNRPRRAQLSQASVSSSEPEEPGLRTQLTRMLSDLEDMVTCSICSEFFVYSTVLSCGHTFCAPCITKWLDSPKQIRQPTCPTCRSRCSKSTAVPNFLVDSFVEKHLILVSSTSVNQDGRSIGRDARAEWESRRREWKKLEEAEKVARPLGGPGQINPPGGNGARLHVQIVLDVEESDLASDSDDSDESSESELDDDEDDDGNEDEPS